MMSERTQKELEDTCHTIGEKFCDVLSEIAKQLEKNDGFSEEQAVQITVSAHLGAVLAFCVSYGINRESLLKMINEMLDDMEAVE
jgi:hypothetical protein